MKTFKNILFVILICSAFQSAAQDFTANWVGHFSYNRVEDIARGNGRIYGASENAVFVFSTLDGSIRTISTVNGLSGNTISAIYYSEDFDTLLIGYENGILDVLVGNSTNVITVVDILNKPSISPDKKRINHFIESNGFAYISTGFGISLYDLGQLEFDDTYFIGDGGAQLNITATAIQGEFIYASSLDGGLRRAPVGNTNIIDFNNWSTIISGSFQGVLTLNESLFLLNDSQLLQATDGNTFTPFLQFPETITDVEANESFLSIVYPGNALVYTTEGSLEFSFVNIEGFTDRYRASIIEENTLYIATRGSGMARVPLQQGSTVSRILPNGPLENNIFGLNSSPGVVYSVFGDYDNNYNAFPLKTQGVSILTNSGWSSINPGDLFGARNLTNITINPSNQSQLYISSFRDGLIEINEGVPVIIYDENNSTFTPVPATTEDVRINGTAFDRNGNLWIANARGVNTLHRLSTGGQFSSVSFEDILPDEQGILGQDDVVVSLDNKVYIATGGAGILGYDPATDTTARLFGEEGAANLPIDDIRALALDRNGTLWIGTRLGLRVLFAPSNIFTEPQVSTSAIIIEQDGLAQELLNDQVVTDILVDGSNNKWVATTDSGVFYFSPNGQETLLHFTTSNSPLPSNNVQDVTIDESSGTVYFGTIRGLVAFKGSETAPAENLENVIVYPNPVRPSFNGEVRIEGLTANTNVKITDLVGNLVYEENTTGGSINWDTTAFGRHKVASGVYLILITGPDALETAISKLMIIR